MLVQLEKIKDFTDINQKIEQLKVFIDNNPYGGDVDGDDMEYYFELEDMVYQLLDIIKRAHIFKS